MSEKDGHILAPLVDQRVEANTRNPHLVVSEVKPPLPKLDTPWSSPSVPFLPNDSHRAIESIVQSAMQGIRINGQSGVQRGSGIEFEIPAVKPAPQQPVISETVHPPAQPPPASTDPFGAPAPAQDQGQEPARPQQPQEHHRAPRGGDVDADPPEIVRGPRSLSTVAAEHTEESRSGRGGGGHRDDEKESSRHPGDQDMTSRGRLEGESRSEWRDRQKEIRELKKDPKVAAAIAEGDDSYFTSNYIPVLLTRGDGERKIISYITEDHSYKVKGPAGGKSGPMPDDADYYLADKLDNDHSWKVSSLRKDGVVTYTIDKGYVITHDGDIHMINGLAAVAGVSEAALVVDYDENGKYAGASIVTTTPPWAANKDIFVIAEMEEIPDPVNPTTKIIQRLFEDVVLRPRGKDGEMLYWGDGAWRLVPTPASITTPILSYAGTPTWIESTRLPDAQYQGDLLQWNDTLERWETCEMSPADGAISYFDGTEGVMRWKVLPAPNISGEGGLTNPVLSHTGTAPEWVEDQIGTGGGGNTYNTYNVTGGTTEVTDGNVYVTGGTTNITGDTLPTSYALGALMQGDGAGDWETSAMAPSTGDMAYFDGTTWVPLLGGSPESGTKHMLTHNGTEPMFEAINIEEVIVVDDGVFKTGMFLTSGPLVAI